MRDDIEDVRRLSSIICGSRYRLEILCTIAEMRTFTASKLLQALWQNENPPAQSIVSGELKKLRESGLVLQQSEAPSGRAIHLKAADLPIWDAIKLLAGGE